MRLAIRSLLFCLCSLALLKCCATSRQDSDHNAIVHLQFVNARGVDIGHPAITLFQGDQGNAKNLAPQFHNNIARAIPFDTYRLRVYEKGYYSVERNIPVYQGEVWAVVQLYVGEENGPSRFQLSGVVRPGPASKGPFWIHVASLYSDFAADGRTATNGTFALAGLPYGTYLLAVYKDDQVLHLRSIVIPLSQPLIIERQ